MTMEISDTDVWESIQKGDITGFSMGGMGVYSEEDVDLPVEQRDEPTGLLRRLANAMGCEVVEKGAVKANFQRRVKDDNFYSAWYALRSTLEGNFYNPDTGMWEWGYNSDESTIREALEDFNDIVTQLLTSDGSIVKSLEKAAKAAPSTIQKEGKSLSAKNLSAIKGIYDTLGTFLADFQEEPAETNNVQKEDVDMTSDEVKAVVAEEVKKAMDPVVEQLKAIAPVTKGNGEGESEPPAPGSAAPAGDMSADAVAKMVGEEIKKAMEPVMKALEPVMKSRAIPGNLNDVAGAVEKQEEHFLHGIV